MDVPSVSVGQVITTGALGELLLAARLWDFRESHPVSKSAVTQTHTLHVKATWVTATKEQGGEEQHASEQSLGSRVLLAGLSICYLPVVQGRRKETSGVSLDPCEGYLVI